MLCSICSTEIDPGDQLCKECGATIDRVEQQVETWATAQEIKPGSALCASIEGYIRLCEILPLLEVGAIVNEYMTRLLPPIQTDGGQINWYTGDKIAAYFGFSEATDYYSPAARAVHAALEMHRVFAEFSAEMLNSYAADIELELRVGVASGQMLRGSLGDETLQKPPWSRRDTLTGPLRPRHRRIVVGDVVNMASQLEYEARPGHILTDPTTVQAARQQFEFNSLGERQLRRRANALEIFSVIGPKPATT